MKLLSLEVEEREEGVREALGRREGSREEGRDVSSSMVLDMSVDDRLLDPRSSGRSVTSFILRSPRLLQAPSASTTPRRVFLTEELTEAEGQEEPCRKRMARARARLESFSPLTSLETWR